MVDWRERSCIAGFGVLLLTSCGSPGAVSTAPAAFAKCAACHSTELGANRGAGPNLYGVVGRTAGQASGFSFSPALRKSRITWSKAMLDRYIADPAGTVPGTRMNVKTPDANERAAIIEYLDKH